MTYRPALDVVRWVLLAPATYAAWFVAAALGLWTDNSLLLYCGVNDPHSTQCWAPWYPTASEAALHFWVAMSAVFVVVTATLMAPAAKRVVAISSLLIGGAFAVYVGIEVQKYFAIAAAISGGAITLWLVLRRLPASNP